jgi:hypothetical protein
MFSIVAGVQDHTRHVHNANDCFMEVDLLLVDAEEKFWCALGLAFPSWVWKYALKLTQIVRVSPSQPSLMIASGSQIIFLYLLITYYFWGRWLTHIYIFDTPNNVWFVIVYSCVGGHLIICIGYVESDGGVMNWDLHRSLCFVILQVICFLLKPVLTSCKTSNASSINCCKHNGKKNFRRPSSWPTSQLFFLYHMAALC